MQKIAIILTSLGCLVAGSATASGGFFDNSPKVGIEIGQRTLHWQENMGKNHFAEVYPQAGVFVEVPLLHGVSVKLGREGSVERNNMAMYPLFASVLSDRTLLNIGAANYYTSAKITSNYVDLLYNINLFNTAFSTNQLVCFFGVAKTKLKISQEDAILVDINDRLWEDLTSSKKTYLSKGFYCL